MAAPAPVSRRARSDLPAFGWVAIFVVLAVATRLGSLTEEVIEWDEATFMIVAQDLIRGHLPYLHLLDNKPPLIFFSLAAMMKIFGQSLAATRLFGALSVVASAIATFAVCRRLTRNLSAGLATCFLIAVEGGLSFGLFTSTELPTAALVMTAMWLALSRGQRFSAAVAAGLCMSLATLFRTNVAYVVVALGLLYLYGSLRAAPWFHRFAVVGFCVGGLVPAAMVVAVYGINDGLQRLFLSTITVALSYAVPPRSYLSNVLGLARLVWVSAASSVIFFVFVALSAIGFFSAMLRWRHLHPDSANRWPYPSRSDLVIILVFVVSTGLSLVAAGLPYDHYLLTAIPIGAIGCALLFDLDTGYIAIVARAAAFLSIGMSLAVRLPQAADVIGHWRSISASYPARRAAEAIAADRQPSDLVWPLADHLVLFYLNASPPIPIATHPDNVSRPEIYQPYADAGLSPDQPFDALIAEEPRYIVFDDREWVPYYIRGEHRARMEALLRTRYSLWGHFGHVVVFRARDR